MIRLELTELADAIERQLPPDVGYALATSGAISAVRTVDGERWALRSTGTVGVARVGDVELRIAPKVPVARLLFLLGYALDPKGWRNEDVDLGTAPNLVAAMAYAFERQAERALRRGLLQGYRTVEEASPVLRGRMRESDQLTRRLGLAVPLEVRYDEFTADIAENRLLRAAAERLLAAPGIDLAVRHRLRRLLLLLADVTRLVPGRPRPRWRSTRLNGHYLPALRLAELALRAVSVEHCMGDVTASGFLFDMYRVFEDFVTVALTEALAASGGRATRQAPGHRLDELGRVVIRPDLVWYDDQQRPRAVVDAKYKAERPGGFPDADLYQMLAYCTALNLPEGHLVYALGNEESTRHTVRHVGTVIQCHALQLDAEPAELLDQVSMLAEVIAGSPRTCAALASTCG